MIGRARFQCRPFGPCPPRGLPPTNPLESWPYVIPECRVVDSEDSSGQSRILSAQFHTQLNLPGFGYSYHEVTVYIQFHAS